MNIKTLVVNVIVLAVLVPCIGLAQESHVGEWKSPFDGKTLEGWKQYVGTAPYAMN